MLDKLVNEVLTSEDCSECSKKCCVYLFKEAGPELQPNEIEKIVNAVLNAREEIASRRAKGKFELLVDIIMNEGIIPPVPVLVDYMPENVCGVYSLEKQKCLIYGHRPLCCKTHPAYVDENGIVWIDKGCPSYEKIACYLKNHGIDVRIDDFLKSNLKG